MFKRADWNLDDPVIKAEEDCSNFDILNANKLELPITPLLKQENFISCGDGSDDESFLPETRTYNNSSSDDESDNNIQHNESENVTIPANHRKTKQNTNNSDQSALQISLCDNKIETLESHPAHIHTGYECEICSNRYSTANTLEKHGECLSSAAVHLKLERNSVSPDTNLTDKQKEANETTLPNNCTTLKNHSIKTYSRKKRSRQICSDCGKVFSSLSLLNIHIREKHLPDTDPRRYFKCSRCDRKFDTEHLLRVHNITHKNVRTYICDYCQREYNLRRNFVNHMYARHSNLPRTTYSCSHCSKGFRSRDHRDDHENTHTGIRPHQCMLCFKDFGSSSSLRRHIKSHNNEADKSCKDAMRNVHKKPHKRTKAQLLTRTDSSSIADSEGKYPCEFCTAVFRYKDKRDSHLNKQASSMQFMFEEVHE